MLETELPKLPDTRSTQRMLNMLAQLEESLANRAAVGGVSAPSSTMVDAEIVRLRRENKALRLAHKQALERLDNLIAAMASAPVSDQTQASESMAA